jgi:calcineurin-like phosphoesterase family protein
MPAVFLYSDPHFGHWGVCRFLRADGVTKLRPWDNPVDMDEELVRRFNERVRPNDKVYFLGDVCINRRALPTLGRLNGDKVLIKGNHDIFRLEEYTPYFRDIRSYHVMNGLILSHIPVHEESLGRFGTNVHGHLHANRVMCTVDRGGYNDDDIYQSTWVPNWVKEIDVRYYNVSVECTDFAPILFEDLLKKIEAEGGTVGFRNGNYGPAM